MNTSTVWGHCLDSCSCANILSHHCSGTITANVVTVKTASDIKCYYENSFDLPLKWSRGPPRVTLWKPTHPVQIYTDEMYIFWDTSSLADETGSSGIAFQPHQANCGFPNTGLLWPLRRRLECEDAPASQGLPNQASPTASLSLSVHLSALPGSHLLSPVRPSPSHTCWNALLSLLPQPPLGLWGPRPPRVVPSTSWNHVRNVESWVLIQTDYLGICILTRSQMSPIPIAICKALQIRELASLMVWQLLIYISLC